jgi:Holliday junction DNA helicase RuvB
MVSLSEGDVLFVDEIHRLPQPAQEILYGVMEDFRLDILAGGEMGGGKMMSIPIPKFTLVGATTRPGMLAAPFRDRFHIILNLMPYDRETLSRIVSRSAEILDMRLGHNVAHEIAGRARGTPRIANRFLRRLRDYAAFHEEETLEMARVLEAFEEMGIAEDGTTETDRKYLELLRGRFAGRPVGLKTLATAMGEDEGTVEWEIEPWLVQSGFVERTTRGRVLGQRFAERLL